MKIGGFRLTIWRVLLLALVVLDIVELATGNGGRPLGIILGFYGLWLLFRRLRPLLLWKLRNRLIVTYLFIAVVPITLILGFFFVAGWSLTGQFAGYLVGAAMENREASVETPARLLVRALPGDRLSIMQQLTATGVPPFDALVAGGAADFRYPGDSQLQMPGAEWKDYTGIVFKGGDPYIMSLVSSGRRRALILMPLTREVLANLVPGLGSLGMPNGLSVTRKDEGQNNAANTVSSIRNAVVGRVPAKASFLDFPITGIHSMPMADWNHPNSATNQPLVIDTRLSAVLGVIVSWNSDDPLQTLFAVIFYVIIGLLGIAEVLSWWIGVSMTRTITGAVHNLYEGTTSIGQGDFSHRIVVPKGRDQLADLSRSFNKMAEQLEQFAIVTKEKERMQSELAIASEVQTRLFPTCPPYAKTIEMLGVCHAARTVSGDYYDYFAAADGELAIALGDVAGKGISAALLMASIQSIMRTQLSDNGIVLAPSDIVARLNHLLYANTSAEKYATFFFGLYNDQTRQLNYTNAGHLPPMMIHNDGYKFLDVTGSVVGAFPSLIYEQQSIPLGSGDILVAYTDGITEPENDYGEDFGADRLAETVMLHRDAEPKEIVAKILEAVGSWNKSVEQADDMTLMIVRGIA